jgi:ribosome-associated protein
MIQVTSELTIDESDIQYDFTRGSGPGGQHVNKVSSAVQLRFDTQNLPQTVKHRLHHIAGSRLTNDGILIINSRNYRHQEANRQAALSRLIELISAAAKVPKARKKTKPSAASKQRRLASKRRHSEIKRLRKPIKTSDE